MSQANELHPFLALMKRYCIDYTNSHDTSWLPEIMTDDYVVNISQAKLIRSEGYKENVEWLFARLPGLGLTVHEFYCNGDRLAMRFSEHARWHDQGKALTTWRGFSTYTWDGTRLTECWVEQDFYARQRQITTGVSNTLEAPGLDPWTTPIVPADPRAEEVARHWLESFDLSSLPEVDCDDAWQHPAWLLEVVPREVIINDCFSAGLEVPFHVDLVGPLRRNGSREGRLAVCGVLSLAPDYSIRRVAAVTDRMTLAVQKLIT